MKFVEKNKSTKKKISGIQVWPKWPNMSRPTHFD